MKVFVTGGTGFIGANLVRHLVARGDEVVALVRKPNLCLEGLPIRMVQADITDADALAPLVRGCGGIYHVAGLFDASPGGIARMREIHVYGTQALLRAAEREGVPRMVVCSSSVTVGFGTKEAPGDEDTPLDPTAIYGERGALRAYHDTKVQSERMAAGWRSVEAVIVNPDYILGAWDVKPTSGQLIVTMAKTPWVPIYPKGGKCFQDVDDCALGHIYAMEKGVPGRRYLLGNENLSYKEFMTMVAEVVGKKPPLLPVPDLALGLAGAVGEQLLALDPHRFAGLDPNVLRSMREQRYRTGRRAVDELGVPQTPIRESVEKAFRWFVDHGYC